MFYSEMQFRTKELLIFGTLLNRRLRNHKSKNVHKIYWFLKQILNLKCSVPPLRGEQFLRTFFPPAERGWGRTL